MAKRIRSYRTSDREFEWVKKYWHNRSVKTHKARLADADEKRRSERDSTKYRAKRDAEDRRKEQVRARLQAAGIDADYADHAIRIMDSNGYSLSQIGTKVAPLLREHIARHRLSMLQAARRRADVEAARSELPAIRERLEGAFNSSYAALSAEIDDLDQQVKDVLSDETASAGELRRRIVQLETANLHVRQKRVLPSAVRSFFAAVASLFGSFVLLSVLLGLLRPYPLAIMILMLALVGGSIYFSRRTFVRARRPELDLTHINWSMLTEGSADPKDVAIWRESDVTPSWDTLSLEWSSRPLPAEFQASVQATNRMLRTVYGRPKWARKQVQADLAAEERVSQTELSSGDLITADEPRR